MKAILTAFKKPFRGYQFSVEIIEGDEIAYFFTIKDMLNYLDLYSIENDNIIIKVQ